MRQPRICLALLSVLLLAGCGTKSASGLDQDKESITGTVGAFLTAEHSITAPRSGTMTVTLTWASAAIDLDLYLTGPDCDGYPPVACTLLAASDAEDTTEESVQHMVSSGDRFKIWVDNFSTTAGSDYTIQITIQ